LGEIGGNTRLHSRKLILMLRRRNLCCIGGEDVDEDQWIELVKQWKSRKGKVIRVLLLLDYFSKYNLVVK
jgi:hypothetical protein